jgi:hypothetical protein
MVRLTDMTEPMSPQDVHTFTVGGPEASLIADADLEFHRRIVAWLTKAEQVEEEDDGDPATDTGGADEGRPTLWA